MTKKRLLISTVVLVVLGFLVYLQVHEWKSFDWEKFASGTAGIRWWHVLIGIGFIYFADFLRAVRWKIFLRPSIPHASWTGLISPQYVGFAGLALLGRPGELIRPYLIGRREGASFSSQMAIWAVERVFDIGAVTIYLLIDIFFVPSIQTINYHDRFVKAGYFLAGILVLLIVMVIALWVHGGNIAAWFCRRLAVISPTMASNFERRLRAFSEGLHTLHDAASFFEVLGISFGLWWLVAMAYRQVTHAYPHSTGLHYLDLPQVILLMGASVAGGVLQLPVVGGGSQLATIAVLDNVFNVGHELAVSCGILLWLVTFMSVTPLGLVLAHREHISLRKLSQVSEEERKAVLPTASP